MKKTQQQPVIVSIYSQTKASQVCDRLKTITKTPVRTLDKSGTVDVEFRFTMKELFLDASGATRPIKEPASVAVPDEAKLRTLAPRGRIEVPGYVTEMRCVGRYNDSPVTLLFGAPDVTRASFVITEKLSGGKSLPESVAKKLASSDPMLTTLCPPTNEFRPDGAIAQAVAIARSRDGVVLYPPTEDGGIMSQNPKAMLIIDECAGVSERALKNTYVVTGSKNDTIQTPGTSLISAIVRCYPSDKLKLVWDDQGGRLPFKVDEDVMFSIPAKVANFTVHEIAKRKQLVSTLYMPIKDVNFAVQASTMHGDWVYEPDTDTYLNRDNDRRVDASTEFTFCARVAISMRYTEPYAAECAVARDHQFYPMPVWPSSGLHNGKPRPGVEPYPSTLYEQVAAAIDEAVGEHGRKRRAAIRACTEGQEDDEGSAAASSSTVDDD